MLRGLLILTLLFCPVLSAQSPVTGVPLLPPASIGPQLYLADFTNDAVYVLEDLDRDGDCNDLDEIKVFYDTTSPDPALHLATPRSMAVGVDGALFVGDANQDFILRLEDLDGDGTANQAGEATIFFDTTSGGAGLVSVSNLVVDADGYLYFSDTGTGATTERHVTRLRDENGDGFCSETDGEVLVIYQLSTTGGAEITRPSGLAIDADGTLIVSDYEVDGLFRLFDTLGAEDGDANDAGEQLDVFVSDPAGVELNFAEHVAFGVASGSDPAPLYVNAGPTEDVVHRFLDVDIDGIWLNPTEVSSFWDISQADGIVPANARTLAVTPDGAVFALEAGAGVVEERVVRLEDLNADGDANDAGEATIYADNGNASGVAFAQPQGMAWELDLTPPPPTEAFIRGDADGNGVYNGLVDGLFVLNFQFTPGSAPPPCLEAADSDDSGDFNGLLDGLFILNCQFVPGSACPNAPFPDCGADLDPSGSLGCDAPLVCP